MSRPFLAPGATPPAEPPRFPPRPTPNTPPRRRGLLGAVAALAAAPAVVVAMPAASPDAELFRECEAAMAAYEAARSPALNYPPGLTFEEAKPYDDESDRLLNIAGIHERRALAIPARTRAGLAAKARTLVAGAIRSDDGTIDTDYGGDVAWALVQEAMGLEGMA